MCIRDRARIGDAAALGKVTSGLNTIHGSVTQPALQTVIANVMPGKIGVAAPRMARTRRRK